MKDSDRSKVSSGTSAGTSTRMTVGFRLSVAARDRAEAIAQSKGLTLSAYLRQLVRAAV